jgi:hypothetical protein
VDKLNLPMEHPKDDKMECCYKWKFWVFQGFFIRLSHPTWNALLSYANKSNNLYIYIYIYIYILFYFYFLFFFSYQLLVSYKRQDAERRGIWRDKVRDFCDRFSRGKMNDTRNDNKYMRVWFFNIYILRII